VRRVPRHEAIAAPVDDAQPNAPSSRRALAATSPWKRTSAARIARSSVPMPTPPFIAGRATARLPA
jgi:hypothetical protein